MRLIGLFFIFITYSYSMMNVTDYISHLSKDKQIQIIEPLQLKNIIQNNYQSNYVILDVREPYEINIEQSIFDIESINIPRGLLEFKINSFLDKFKNKNIIILCKAGSRAKLSYLTLKQMSFPENIFVLNGGLDQWKKDCYPTTNNFNLLFEIPKTEGCKSK